EIEAKNRWQDGFNLGRSLLSLGSNYLLLPLKIWQFKRRLNRVLSQQKTDLEYLRIDELVNHYRDLEQQLLPHWQAPIINDFFAMIFYGLLRKFTARWGEESGDAIANTLIQQQSRQQRSRQSSGTEAGQMISARPARQIHAMAQEIRATPALIDTFCRGTRSEIQATLNYHPPLAAQYAAYLNEFSDRCLDELKLESPTLADDPLPLLRSIGLVARDQAVQAQGNGSRPRPSRPPLHLKRRLRALGLQRLWLGFLVHNARARLRDRENLRFERTRVFGLARKLFLEMGKRLFALDAIAQAHDIFYLEINEILGFTEGTSTCTDLKSLIALRRAEFESYRQTESPPNRLSTYGVPYPYPEQRAAAIGSTALATSDRQRQGLGCSPGIVRGVVRLIRDPHQALAAPKGIPTGAILVAERTDPGWILLFPMAAGLVVERGSLLSHAAIVSRELGLPAIVSVPGVMTWLQDGDWVELDGGTGRVVKIESRQ
ncbi:MAG: PEP-utilizing enzyme, partial [Spirulinaceae cyanobacterium]